jgi:hypothetical protein
MRRVANCGGASSIFYSIISATKASMPSFLSLPSDILIHGIWPCLDIRSRLRLTATCKQLYKLTENDSLWISELPKLVVWKSRMWIPDSPSLQLFMTNYLEHFVGTTSFV